MPKIQYTLNTMESESTKKTAYELAFGIPASTNIFPQAEPRDGNIFSEEELLDIDDDDHEEPEDFWEDDLNRGGAIR